MFEAFVSPYLREMCSAIIIYSSTMKLTRASLSKSFTVTDVQQAGQWFKTCCHREAELQPYCVCVCFWSPETKCMQQSTGSSSADWLLGIQWWSWSAGVCSLQESLPISRGWSSPGSSWKMAARSPTTTSRRWAGNAAPEKWRLFCKCGLRVQFDLEPASFKGHLMSCCCLF